MRKIGSDQFYKPSNSTLTPSQAQLQTSQTKTNSFQRYQSPQMKLNQGGITAKQTQGVPVATQNQVMSASM